MLALGIAGVLFACVSLFTQSFFIHSLLIPCLPFSIWLIKTGRKHWYFEEIDAASNRMGDAYTFKLQEERSSIETLLHTLKTAELTLEERVEIRQELKALILSLEAQEGLESVVHYWQKIPYLEPVREEMSD
ncbi:MAG: FlxA-like family protein [Opitutales bacterium]